MSEFVNSEWNGKTQGKCQCLIGTIACILLAPTSIHVFVVVLIVWNSIK